MIYPKPTIPPLSELLAAREKQQQKENEGFLEMVYFNVANVVREEMTGKPNNVFITDVNVANGTAKRLREAGWNARAEPTIQRYRHAVDDAERRGFKIIVESMPPAPGRGQ